MIPMADYGSIMEWAIGCMVNSEYDVFKKLSKVGFGKTAINVIFAIYFVAMVWLYDVCFIPVINSLMTIKLVWKMAVKAAIMLYKREWDWGTWYETSLRLCHIMPYSRLGIRL